MRITDTKILNRKFRDEGRSWFDTGVTAISGNFPYLHIRFLYGYGENTQPRPVIGFDFNFNEDDMSPECVDVIEKMNACKNLRGYSSSAGYHSYDITFLENGLKPVSKDERSRMGYLLESIYALAEKFDSFNKLENPKVIDITMYSSRDTIGNILKSHHYSNMFKNCVGLTPAPDFRIQ